MWQHLLLSTDDLNKKYQHLSEELSSLHRQLAMLQSQENTLRIEGYFAAGQVTNPIAQQYALRNSESVTNELYQIRGEIHATEVELQFIKDVLYARRSAEE